MGDVNPSLWDDIKLMFEIHPISRIPCLFESLLYGNLLGVGFGLGTLAFTGRSRISVFTSLYSSPFLVVGLFAYCRGRKRNADEKVRLVYEVKEYFEGTKDEDRVNEAFKSGDFAAVRRILDEKKARMIEGMMLDRMDDRGHKLDFEQRK